MILTILFAWLSLALFGVLFLYCCSRVSYGPWREHDDDAFTAEAQVSVRMRSGKISVGNSTRHLRPGVASERCWEQPAA